MQKIRDLPEIILPDEGEAVSKIARTYRSHDAFVQTFRRSS
jgi:hypothetical protein